MEANLFSILVFGVPVLAGPVALIFGLRKTLIGVLAIAVLMLVAPYVYFGIWALAEGESLLGTLGAVSVSLPAAAIVLGWMLAWSAAYGAIAAMIRLGWLHWRGVRT
ncbi:hypothetical protein [uncultured Tateyamaria sp.]|uniref:hypothetical protein n=1 Tax=uncultured Tateyamaria sp. TaxID=455651 RepID=UPI00262CBF99|nr:hypothetical protein [uncultured Tateyamaria sp.]